MNTVKIEKLLKKELKKLDSDLYDRVESIRVFAQIKYAKKPEYCIIFTLEKEKTPSLNYFARMKDEGGEKDLKAIYFDVLGEFVKACGKKKSSEEDAKDSKEDALKSVLKKRWKKIKKELQ
jgi:hypothetical protein